MTAADRGRRSRRRGADAERQVVAYLRAHGWPDARRYLAGESAGQPQFSGKMMPENRCGPGAALTAPDLDNTYVGGAVVAKRTVAERFWSKVDKSGEGGCWLWTAGTFRGGYGQFAHAKPKKVSAHRWAYEQIVGPIPDGLVLDHLCRVPACVNPAHLEPVTLAENTRRGIAPKIINSTSGECMAGHPRTPDNLYTHPGSGQKDCRQCARDRERTRLARLREDFAAGRIARPHGVRSTYDKYGCRCDACTRANTAHAARTRR